MLFSPLGHKVMGTIFMATCLLFIVSALRKRLNTWLTLVINCDRLRPKIDVVDLHPFDCSSISQSESMETKQNRVKALVNLQIAMLKMAL